MHRAAAGAQRAGVDRGVRREVDCEVSADSGEAGYIDDGGGIIPADIEVAADACQAADVDDARGRVAADVEVAADGRELRHVDGEQTVVVAYRDIAAGLDQRAQVQGDNAVVGDDDCARLNEGAEIYCDDRGIAADVEVAADACQAADVD